MVGYQTTIGMFNFHFSRSCFMYRYSKCQGAIVIIDMASQR